MPTTTPPARRPRPSTERPAGSTTTPAARRAAAACAALALGAALVAAGPAAASAVPPAPLAPVASAAAVAAPLAVPGDGGGLLELAGEPLVHTFDLDRPGDAVSDEWTVTARSARSVAFDGVLRPDGDPSPGLAAALVVEYGSVGPDGAVTGWHEAGTLAEPRSYADALGVDAVAHPGRPVAIPVRVSLPDPSLVTGEPGEKVVVEATFVVTYLAPGDGDGSGGGGDDEAGAGAGAGAGGGRGPLALTGADAWWVAALAAAALGTGAVLRRRRDGGPAQPPTAA